VMPGMGGRDLAQRVAALRPEVRVLYVSGYTRDAALQEEMARGGSEIAFLEKPYTPLLLARRVRETLDAPARRRAAARA
jgi:FixJ family two-component response regulator